MKLTLTAGKRTVGTAKVSLAGGARRTVTVKLNAAGRKQLLKKKLKVQLKVTTVSAPSPPEPQLGAQPSSTQDARTLP